MSGKITRDITTHLFKYVKRVDITFNPFDGRTTSARELMRQVQASRFKKANPKLVIETNVSGTVDPPAVKFEFVDGNIKTFDSQNFIANDMLGEVYDFANSLDIEYELAGKSIDDQ
mmetsp:Transcript_15626/g.23479  ORF Transcript_15626/g.23479 Transcript_15626/m.23479 type:complete len:116 (-) Transcript_15626:204-551(-)|eukprot:CAMPEP_0203672318 /NCGR_PEP_ID=MMETSP0090-20130426/8189_1 /ASSEMBLY_ACC=CAM_ASM_001088 /TAXON_ID=426623 /ORGANISM="Chaetoceros affinis, Strain CCMP159" /LENGTH=115 /DNA_ID=CAMNT_0050537619 /DNA_START=86 /DNA_END=433 /DNA_ORIENTATION=+